MTLIGLRFSCCFFSLWLAGIAAAFAQTNGTPWTSQIITNYVSPIVGGTPDTVAVWYGNRVAIVVDPQSSLPSPNFATMTNIAFAFDNLYTAYDQVTGQTPLTGNYLLNGKIRVEFTTNMPSGVAGTASDNSGYYGIAVGNGFMTYSGELYARYNQGIQTVDQAMFYESQRDYWTPLFNTRIDYATLTQPPGRANPNSWGWWTVGFNNAMSIFMSQGVIAGVTNMYYYGQNAQQFAAGMMANLTTYTNNPQLYNFTNSWCSDWVPWSVPGNPTSVNDLMTATLIDLYNHYGGQLFLSNLYREIPRSAPVPGWPNDITTACNNFYAAASRAAGTNLISYFTNILCWPVTPGYNYQTVYPMVFWNGNVSTAWSNVNNWTGFSVVPSATNVIAFSGSSNTIVDLHGNQSVFMLTFDPLANATFTIGNSVAGTALTIASNGAILKLANNISIINQIITTPIILAGDATFGNQSDWVQDSSELIISNTITGSNTIHIAGQQVGAGGGIVLLADNSATFKGRFQLDSSMLLVGNNNALGSATNAPTLINQGNLWFAGGITCPGSFIINGPYCDESSLNGCGISGNIQINSNFTWTVTTGGGNATALSGVLSGPGNLLMTYGGVTLSGFSNNTLSGLVQFDTTSGNNLLTLNKSGGAIAIAGSLELDESAIAVCGNTNQFSTNSIVTVNGNAILQLNGKNQIIGGLADTNGGFVADDVNTTAATLTLNSPAGSTNTFAGILCNTTSSKTGKLSLTKTGAGTQMLSGVNTFSGSAIINSGSLAIANTNGSGLGTNLVTVNASGTLMGNGSLSNSVVVNGGTLAVGNLGATSGSVFNLLGPGSLKFTNNGVLSVNLFSGAGGGNNTNNAAAADKLNVQLPVILTNTATLTVNNPNGMTAWAAGDKWKIANWSSVTGTFTSTNLPVLPTSLIWDLSALYSSGVIGIALVSPTKPAQILKASLIGTNLVFTGTNMNGGTNFHFLVLTATNLATPLTNWTVVSTNSFQANGTFGCTNGVSSTRPAAFFQTKAVP